MRDYKHLVHTHYAARPKWIAAKASKSKSSEKLFFGYQFKFYLTIALLLGATGFYIRHQINHNPKSIFYEIHKLYKKHFFVDSKPVKKEKSANAPVSTEIQDKQEKMASDAISRPVNLYQLTLKNGAATFVPVTDKIKSNKKKFFGNLIHRLIHHDSSDRRTINSFDSHVVLKAMRIENDVLLLDFNRAFEYNRFGYMGLSAQIQQVLWTVFKSPQAKKEKIRCVSFLIEGKRKRKIGGEGLDLKLFYTIKDLKNTVRLSST